MNALDARHRAMLLDMGVRVWPAPQALLRSVAQRNEVSPASATTQAKPLTREPRQPTARPAPQPAPLIHDRSAAPASAWLVQAPQLLYPQADPSQVPAALGAGWLIVAEFFAQDDPVAAAAERLLGNMLHALQLHRHPRVALCSLVPAGPGAVDSTEQDAAASIARHVATFAPSVVFVMGRDAVRAALARSEPLGKLRGAPLAIAGVPTVATFGPHFLLRNPQSKRAAWADLCRARLLAGPADTEPVP